MKNFVKMTLATIAGLFIFGFIAMFLMVAMVGAIASFGDSQPVMPREAVLTINMSGIMLAEQTKEADPIETISAGGESISSIGIWDAINAINSAAADPAVKFIYLKPDGISGHYAQTEEFRKALQHFRAESGKAIVAYTESPSNGSYYLASVADKIYMNPYEGGILSFNGVSTQLIFLKDILDRLGINMQLIRHGKYKSAGEMYIKNSASPENLEQNEAMVKSIWESISSEIAESRGISTDDLNRMLDNLELNSPQDFLDKGLVDELLGREALQEKLTSLFMTDKYENVKSISLQDYAKLKKTVNYKAENKVAVIYADGNIVDGKEKQQIAGDRFAQIIADVRKNSTVKAVVLRVNSPGGSVLASEKIKAELDLLRETTPIIASYGGYAASGGYWISANSDFIFSNETTLTGSIGVFSMIPDASKAINDKLHVHITPINSNKHADMLNGMRPLDAQETAYMQASVEKIYDQFTQIVASGRNMTVPQVDEIAQGRVWTGAEAVANGLADEIGSIEDAIIYAALSIEGVENLADVQIAEYPKPQTTLEMLMESLGGTTPSVLAGTPFENIEAAFNTAQATETGKTYARLPYEYVIR
jgi:protease-4